MALGGVSHHQAASERNGPSSAVHRGCLALSAMLKILGTPYALGQCLSRALSHFVRQPQGHLRQSDQQRQTQHLDDDEGPHATEDYPERHIGQ